MAVLSDQQWRVMGFDVRQLGRLLFAAWRDVLFDPDSPLRRRLDEPVAVDWRGEPRRYQALRWQQGRVGDAACAAVCLDSELYLVRRLSLPAVARAELDAVLAREVQAHSPFAADDTAAGWRVLSTVDGRLDIALCIAARSALASALARQVPGRDLRDCELWGEVDGEPVVFRGFGERRRDLAYRGRLLRVTGLALAALLALLLAVWAFAGSRVFELHRLEAVAASLRQQAAEPLAARERLSEANALIAAAADLHQRQARPHEELARLTRLIPDSAFLAHVSLEGDKVRIRGQADNAAAIMETLAAEGAYADVTAPQAITRVARTEREQFHLDLTAAARVDGDRNGVEEALERSGDREKTLGGSAEGEVKRELRLEEQPALTREVKTP